MFEGERAAVIVPVVNFRFGIVKSAVFNGREGPTLAPRPLAGEGELTAVLVRR